MTGAGLRLPLSPGRGQPWSLAPPPACADTAPLRLAAWLYLAVVSVLFSVGGGLLWEFGVNYDGITGAAASKIHPGTYLVVPAFCLLLFGRANPASAFAALCGRYPGSLLLLVAAGAVFAAASLSGRPGIAGLIDTYIAAALVAIVAIETARRTARPVEAVLHALMAVNALLTCCEFVVRVDLIPYRFDGVPDWEQRPSGLQGIAVDNAVVTGTYLVALLTGGGPSLRCTPRVVAIALQAAALLGCGERAAAGFGAIMAGLVAGRALIRILTGARVKLAHAAVAALGAPALVVALAVAVGLGVFDSIVARFESDGGSAMARLKMFEMFRHLSWQEVLIGPDVATVDASRRALGLEVGIENPLVRTVLYQGALATAALSVGVIALLRQTGRLFAPGWSYACLFFAVAIMSFESLGTKTTLLSKFLIMMLAMFPHPEGDEVA